jgi:hypothetical protein
VEPCRALKDCLRGKWGTATPFQMGWSEAEIVPRHLGEEKSTMIVADWTEADVNALLVQTGQDQRRA